MEERMRTLKALYEIVKNDSDPTTYPCSLRELIIKGTSDTSILQEHLEQLAADGLVVMKKLDRVVVCITEMGIGVWEEIEDSR